MTETSTPETSETPAAFTIPEEYVTDGKILGTFESIPAMMDALGSGKTVQPPMPSTPPMPETPPIPGAPNTPPADAETPGGPLQIPTPPAPPETALTPEEMNAYAKQFFDNGKLDDGAYEALQAKGIPRAMVDQYIQGQQAMYQQAQAQVETALGGAEQVQKILAWAGTNLPQARQDALNAQLATADPATAATLLRGLAQEAMIPTGGLAASTNPGLAANPFYNTAELQQAIEDPRYGKDHAYTREVQERAKASQTAGRI